VKFKRKVTSFNLKQYRQKKTSERVKKKRAEHFRPALLINQL